MEFTYTVTESDYITAWKLRRTGGGQTMKTIAFWAIILICLIGVWAIVTQDHAHQPVPRVAASAASSGSVMGNVLPFVLILGLWIYMLSRLGPRTMRTLYRKDPLMQGQFAVKTTPESLEMTNTAGFASQARWGIYQSWREAKNVIVLLMASGAFFVLVVSGLSEAERSELRGILSAALPRK